MADTPKRSSGNRASRVQAQTPSNRINVEAPSSNRVVHTPLDRTGIRDLTNSVRRGLSASGGRRGNAPTPHATAARTALNQRRNAMFTPGKLRRRSLKEQRETPLDLLRTLGRALAPSTNVIASSSSPRDGRSNIAPIREEVEDDDDDDDLPIDRPRLSLPLVDDDDDLQPPQSAGLEDQDDNYTIPAIELPRETVNSRYSRGSFGSIRGSDAYGNDDTTGIINEQSEFMTGLLEDIQANAGAAAYARQDDPTLRSALGRDSDFALSMPPGLEDNTTFMFSEPAEDMAPTSPIEGGRFASAAAEADEPTRNVTFIVEDPSVLADPPADDDDDGGAGGAVYDYGEEVVRRDDEEEEEEGDGESGMEAREDFSVLEATARSSRALPRSKKTSKKRISRHGTEYPPLPPAFVKRVAQRALQSSGLSNTRMSKDVVTALTQASDWFFEQLGDDLGAYADHAKRKTIEESDVVTLMRRQRQIGNDSTMFSLAQRHLPRELLQELRMPVPEPTTGGRKGLSRTYDDENDEDSSEIT